MSYDRIPKEIQMNISDSEPLLREKRGLRELALPPKPCGKMYCFSTNKSDQQFTKL